VSVGAATRPRRPVVIYVSYDGMDEPLGQSQVMAYLERLAESTDVTLISFEKAGADRAAVRERTAARGIRWVPLRYHRRPPVLSTLWDVARGRRALARESRRRAADIVHVRSYVPAFIALPRRARRSARLLFDMRGFWADERVEGGLWRAGGALYRVAKGCERRFLAAADAVVTLSHASVPQIREWLGESPAPVQVIPTCVEVDRFADRPERPDGPHAVWSGSVGTWYRFDLAVRLARSLGLPLTVLTRETRLARDVLAGQPADVRSVRPSDMPDELFAGDVGLCLLRSSFSKTASTPTRFAEYLAAGMPVAVTPGVGDLEELVADEGVGVVVRAEDDASLGDAAEELKLLAGDPAVRARCRALARSRFDVEAGARAYAALYEDLRG
jgi:glycosyltransferase involved in cell wall biosynthesis